MGHAPTDPELFKRIERLKENMLRGVMDVHCCSCNKPGFGSRLHRRDYVSAGRAHVWE